MTRLITILLFCLGLSNVLSGQCEIGNLIVEPLECVNGEFLVHLDFDFVNNQGDQFGVVGNGTNYGLFPYATLPITLGPLPGNGTTEWEFVVYDLENPECDAVFILGPISCCGFNELFVADIICENQESYSAVLNFNPVNTGNLGFDVFANNGEFLGFFLYDSLPVIVTGIPIFNIGVTSLMICDNDNPNCCEAIEFPEPECPNGDCEIWNIDVLVSDCENGNFFITLGFNHENGSGSFTVNGNGNNYGTFSYEDLPITLGPLEGDGETIYEFVVTDAEFESCNDFVVLEPVNCPGDCDIFELVAEAFECDNETNTFALYIDFGWAGTSTTFNVYKGDLLIGTVEGANLPDTLYGLTDDGGGALITVCSTLFPDCCASDEIPVPQCGLEPCDIFELVAEAFECDTATNTFALYLDFEWTGEVESFDVFKGDVHIGFVNGGNLPDTIYGLTDDGGGALITVCANDNPECCASIEIDVPQCGEEPCDISELIAEAFECDTATNTFAIYLDFDWIGNDELFNVYKGDLLIGTVIGAQLPDTIYGLTDNGGGALITVCAANHPDCCTSREIAVPDCGDEECEIFEVGVDTGDCTSDSTFQVAITYLYQGFTNEFVELWTGDTYLGLFHVDIQPIFINDFPWNGQNVMPLRICQNDHPDCCRTIEFEVPNCGGECSIFEVSVEPIVCTSDSTFGAIVSFQTQGFAGPIQVWAGDDYLGAYSQVSPLLLGNIPEHEGGIVLTLCQAENPECCTEFEFQGLVCADGCVIAGLTATPSDCDSAGMFYVTLDFDFVNEGPGFGVLGNGENYGVFSYSQVPLTIGPLSGDGTTVWEFLVVDLGNISCSGVALLEPISCDTTGIFSGPNAALPLDIHYNAEGALIMIPEGATSLSMWTYDGRLIPVNETLTAGERLSIDKYISIPGLYFVQVKTAERVYVGKVVGF